LEKGTKVLLSNGECGTVIHTTVSIKTKQCNGLRRDYNVCLTNEKNNNLKITRIIP
jgi:hypothetical protein